MSVRRTVRIKRVMSQLRDSHGTWRALARVLGEAGGRRISHAGVYDWYARASIPPDWVPVVCKLHGGVEPRELHAAFAYKAG